MAARAPLQHKRRTLTSQRAFSGGFTIIELSMVLVIIGLVLGAVLVGRDLIWAAKIRATVSQVEQFNTAVNTFIGKYNCLPGDCITPGNFGFDPTTDGNGDGIIGICTNQATCVWNVAQGKEAANFWYHLNAANLISGNYHANAVNCPGIDSPASKIAPVHSQCAGGGNAGGWIVVNNAPFGFLAGGSTFADHSLALATSSVFPGGGNGGSYAPADMYAIDAKIDDGWPSRGRMRAFSWDNMAANPGVAWFSFEEDQIPAGYGIGPGGANVANCVRNDMSPRQYNVQYKDSAIKGLCGAVIKGAF